MFRVLLALVLALVPFTALAGSGTVAVLYFDYAAQDELVPLKVGLADLLIADLVSAEAATVVERGRLQEILDELELGHSGVVDSKTAAKVGKVLGAEYVVVGSYFKLAGQLSITAKIVRVETTEVLDGVTVTGKLHGFMDLEDQLADQLAALILGRIHPGAVPDAPAPRKRSGDGGTAVVAPDKDELAAATAFSEGLISMDRKDAVAAREAFERAVVADPQLQAARDQLAKLDL